jgi:hypothetical protein
MNNRHSPEVIHKRRGVFYHTPQTFSPGTEFYMHMFQEDVSLGIMPIGGRSSRPGFNIKLCPADKAAQTTVIAGLERDHHGNSLADTLWEFLRLVAADVCAAGEATFEIVYLEEPKTQKLVGFDLAFISQDQLVKKWNQLYQVVPADLARNRNVSELIPLAEDELLIFKPPPEFDKSLRDLRENLAELDRSRFPLMLVEATRSNIPYDFTAHQRSMNLALVEAVKPIGWNARGTFNNFVLSYYWIRMSLTFEKFKIRLREAMLATLNRSLQRIGEKVGFKAEIKMEGLPTIADVDNASNQLASGAMPFTEVMKVFELR